MPNASAAETHIRLNAGGPTVGDWQSDSGHAKGGEGFPFPGQHDASEVIAPAPNPVYESVRHADHRYEFPDLPNGDYVVRLHFTDGFQSRERAMDYRIEGKQVIDDFSIYDAAGKRAQHVVVKDIPVSITDGDGLQIECLKDRGNDVFEAAVEVLSASLYDKLMKGKAMASVKKTIQPEPTPSVVAAPLAKVEPLPAGVANVKDEVSRQVLRLTGGRRVRLVWAEVGNAADMMVTNGKSTRLFGLDTGEEGGERLIMEEKDGYSKPLLTPSGTQIIFTNQAAGKCYIVNWNGKGRLEFAKGFASDCWRDPATGIDWVYVRDSVGNTEGAMVRRRLDQPDVVETVWDRSPNGNATVPWFRLSADGRYAADAFPWPKCGLADLQKGSWKLRGNGCWTSIAPDNSYRHFYFQGSHTELAMFDHGSETPRPVLLNTMEGMAGKKVYHPRWSSDPRFLTVTGPERNSRSELYLGRFDAGFTKVEDWVRITKDKTADYYGAAWIEPDPNAKQTATAKIPVARPVALPTPRPSSPMPAAVSDDADWPGSHQDLAFVWQNNNSENQLLDDRGGLLRICSGELRGKARFTRHFGLDLRSGHFAVDGEDTAKNLLADARASNQLTLEAVITTSDLSQAGPARIISFSSGQNARNFTLGQEADQLVLRLRTSSTGENGTTPEVKLGAIKAGAPTHVLVRYRDGLVEAFLNGERTLSSDAIHGGFENWTAQEMILFGDEVGGGRNWSGDLEGVAIYTRALGDAEVAWHHAQAMETLEARKPAERMVVEAELVEVSRVPEIDEIDSYRRSIMRNHYRVRKVISGKAPKENDIVVTEWAVMDRQPVEGAGGKIGDVNTLVLEPFDQHPELKSDWVQDDLSVFDLQVYHRVEP